MVNQKVNITELLSGEKLTPIQSQYLTYLLKEYPYFQQALGIYTAYLKKNNLFYKNALQQTAVRSIDRSVLFEWLQKTNRHKQQVSTVSVTEISTQTKGIPQSHNKLVATEKTPNQQEPVIKTKDSKTNKESNTLSTEETFIHEATPEILINENVIKQLTSKENKTKSIAGSVKTSSKEKRIKKQAKKIPEFQNKTEKLNYFDWIKQFNKPKNQKNKEIFDAIDKFLKERPKIVPQKDIKLKTPVIVEKSVEEKQMLMTETLANLYVKQHKYEKAIQAFKILSLKYPKKSSYFANRIKEIKKNLK